MRRAFSGGMVGLCLSASAFAQTPLLPPMEMTGMTGTSAPIGALPAPPLLGSIPTPARPVPVYGFYPTQWRAFPGSSTVLAPTPPESIALPKVELTSRGAAADRMPPPGPVPSETPGDNPPLLPPRVDNTPPIQLPVADIQRAIYEKPLKTPIAGTRPAARIDVGGVAVAPADGGDTPAPAAVPSNRPRLGIPKVE